MPHGDTLVAAIALVWALAAGAIVYAATNPLRSAAVARSPGVFVASAAASTAVLAGMGFVAGGSAFALWLVIGTVSVLAWLVACRWAFVRAVGREPRDVIWNWSKGLLLDRVYAGAQTIPSLLLILVVLRESR